MSDAFVQVNFPNGISGIYKKAAVNPAFSGMNCNVINIPFEVTGFIIDGTMYNIEGEKVDKRSFPKMGEIEITRGILTHPTLRTIIATANAPEVTEVKPKKVKETPPPSIEKVAKDLGLKIPQENASA